MTNAPEATVAHLTSTGITRPVSYFVPSAGFRAERRACAQAAFSDRRPANPRSWRPFADSAELSPMIDRSVPSETTEQIPSSVHTVGDGFIARGERR